MKVKCCVECPFRELTYCDCPSKVNGHLIHINSDKTKNYISKSVPDWCPLRKESITIELDK